MFESLKAAFSHISFVNGMKSVLLLGVIFLLIFFIRRWLNQSKLPKARIRLINTLVARFFLLVYGILLVRIWAFTQLFSFFNNPTMKKMVWTLIAFGIVYGLLYFVRSFINTLHIPIADRHQYRKRASYIATLIFVIILIPIWAATTQQWTTIFSILGAGIALALHEVLLNIAGWVYIVIRHPYRTGDRIELGDVKGDVIDVRVFQTTLLEIGNWVDGDQSTGRVVQVPHGRIFHDTLYNYTQGFEYIWNEFSVLITFESDWEKARDILLKFGEEESSDVQQQVKKKIDRMAREYLIYYKNFFCIVYTKIEDSGVKVTLRYLTEAKQRRSGQDDLSRKILKAFHEASGIEFAYPTYRIYKRGEEGEGKA
ncbi:MAG: mechanosensitive ion channel family protein [Deltaproteobacteria bacterium]|nr:mechanosensitive ion channel family protein [Deltaproteobacteria bacterium]